MSRTLKGTRARGLPPKVLLSQRQDATGSFPTVWRTSSDNRTGKYPVFFNDDKVIPFNQYEAADYDSKIPLGNAVYVEKSEYIGPVASGDPKTILFSQSFTGAPIVVITELNGINNLQNINVFLTDLKSNSFIIKFSSDFTGSIVYRAVYDPSPGTLRVVERKPRYPNTFTRFIAKKVMLEGTNTADITFNDFGDDTAENFITFFDNSGNGQSDIWPNITKQTRTLVALTASSIATATVEFQRFHGLHNRGIIYPLGMNQSAILTGLSQENQIEMYGSVSFMSGAVVNQPTKWIVASGDMKKNIADTFITFTPGQDIQAFRDNSNPAVDGKVSSSVNGINPFYATGSAVRVTGQGFQQPLWSKSKIEIDLTPSAVHTISLPRTGSVGTSFPMMYWNAEKKRYEGIGLGKPIGGTYAANTNGLKSFLDDQTIGFSACVDGGGVSLNQKNLYNVYGRQISNFGFPYAQKFQPTGSQQINMSYYLSEPFLLEKLVVEVSAAIDLSGSLTSRAAIWTFCMLNTRNMLSGASVGNQTIIPYNASTAGTSFVTSSVAGSSYLDVIDYCQISFTGSNPFSATFEAGGRELTVTPISYNGATSTAGYRHTGQMVVTSSVKNSISHQGGTADFSGSSAPTKFLQSLNLSSRNQITNANGRDWRTSEEKPEIIGFATLESISTPINSFYFKENPYLLLPSDKITLAWHLPWPTRLAGGGSADGVSSITFSPQGINKITLYGSSLRVNPETNQLEEHHDTLNQLLSSDSIHENLG
jgi:hypothetical protein